MFKNSLFLFLLLFTSFALQSQIVNIEDKRQSLDTIGWFGRIDLGGNLTKNSSAVYSVNTGFRLDRKGVKGDWLFMANYQMIRASNENFINLGFLHLRHGRPISEGLAAEFFVQTQYDERLNLQYRQLLGGGARILLKKSETLNAYLGLMYMYEYDELAEGTIVFRDHRLSSYLSLEWQPNAIVQLSNTTYYQPLLEDIANSRLASVTGLNLKIGSQLSFTSKFSITFDARLAKEIENVPDTTYSWLNGVRFSF